MKRSVIRSGATALALTALFTLGVAIPLGQEQEKPTFDPAADAKEMIGEATRLAAKKHRRVLVLWGSETGQGDLDLYRAVRRGKTEKWPFYYEYVITPIDSGEKNAELAKSLGAPAGADAAVLTILDAKGKSLAHRAASEFLGDEGWDAGKLGAFLTEHIVEARDAEKVMKQTLAEAAKQNKRVFVHLGAPW